MLNYKLLTVLAIIVTSGILFDNAFADFSPQQPNANVSYNSLNNEVQLDWDFTTGGVDAPQTCLLKGDFAFYRDVNTKFDTNGVSGVDFTKIYGFIPKHYSVVSSSPQTNTAGTAEVIPCTGSTRINLDTIRSHSTNVDLEGNHPLDLEIFLTFYAIDSVDDVGGFNFGGATLMDEIFVFYTPTSTWSAEALTYACTGQIGNTIYIDQSVKGIHTNNGDNCNKYLELDSDQWIDIASNGDETPGTHDELFLLLIRVFEAIIATVNGGSDDDHNSRPTFGMDHKRFTQLVDEGLVVNGQVIPVLDNFHTEMDIIELSVGDIQNFTSTVFAPHTLKTLEFVFGVPELGEWNEREASIEIETNYDGEALDFKINDDSSLIDATSLVYSASKVKCNAEDNTDACYRVSIEFSFLEAPTGKVLALQAIDNSRKNEITYFNDGLDITGDSLNPPTVQQIISEIKYKGLQTIQRIDKVNDIWMTLDKSEPVITYQQNSHGTFIPMEYRVFEKTPDAMTSNPDRLHSEFIKSIKFEQKRAVQYFDSALYLSQLPDAWSHHWKETDRMAEIIDDIEAEKKRTQEVYENTYPDYEKAKSNFKE